MCVSQRETDLARRGWAAACSSIRTRGTPCRTFVGKGLGIHLGTWEWMRPENRGRRFLDPPHASAHPGPPFLPVSLGTLHGSWLSWVGAREESVAVLGATRTPPASARKQRCRAVVGFTMMGTVRGTSYGDKPLAPPPTPTPSAGLPKANGKAGPSRCRDRG